MTHNPAGGAALSLEHIAYAQTITAMIKRIANIDRCRHCDGMRGKAGDHCPECTACNYEGLGYCMNLFCEAGILENE